MHAIIAPQAITRLEAIPGVVGITGDCGFLMNYQKEARRQAKLPCFISAVMQCHILSCSFSVDEEFLVLTANGESLRPSFNKMLAMAHVTDPERQARFHVLGCENVDGFDAVAKGEKVDVPRVTPGIVKIASEAVAKNPKIRAILLECTELPPYADSLRRALKMPVLDATGLSRTGNARLLLVRRSPYTRSFRDCAGPRRDHARRLLPLRRHRQPRVRHRLPRRRGGSEGAARHSRRPIETSAERELQPRRRRGA